MCSPRLFARDALPAPVQHAALRTRHLASSPPEATSNPTAASSGSSDGFGTPFPSSVAMAAPEPLRSYGAQHIYNRGSVSSVSTSGTLDEVSLDCLCDEPDSHGACFYANFSAFGCAAEVQRTLMVSHGWYSSAAHPWVQHPAKHPAFSCQHADCSLRSAHSSCRRPWWYAVSAPWNAASPFSP